MSVHGRLISFSVTFCSICHLNFTANIGSSRHPSAVESDTPSYWVEHLATFAVGREFGLQYPEDGVRKLKQLENSSAIWAQPMVLRLRPSVVSVEDENGVRIFLKFDIQFLKFIVNFFHTLRKKKRLLHKKKKFDNRYKGVGIPQFL